MNGCPAGFVELDGRNSGEVEIVHLGVMPEHSRRSFFLFLFLFFFFFFFLFSFFLFLSQLRILQIPSLHFFFFFLLLIFREPAYLKVLVEFAVAASFSQSECGRLFAKESSGKYFKSIFSIFFVLWFLSLSLSLFFFLTLPPRCRPNIRLSWLLSLLNQKEKTKNQKPKTKENKKSK